MGRLRPRDDVQLDVPKSIIADVIEAAGGNPDYCEGVVTRLWLAGWEIVPSTRLSVAREKED